MPDDYKGMGLDDNRSLLELLAFEQFHDGRCALCGQQRGLVRDHCHASNLVRGFLCRACNRMESSHDGVFEDYRRRNPATILDYFEPYGDGPTNRERFGMPSPRRVANERDAMARLAFDDADDDEDARSSNVMHGSDQ